MQQKEKYFDLYDKITSLIIKELENGNIPWRKPWQGTGLAKNLLTKRVYTGINQLLLSSLPYPFPQFLTWQQVHSVGGTVSKGEKGHLVVFTKKLVLPNDKDPLKTVNKTILRYFTVFNVSQCANIPDHLLPRVLHSELEPITVCEFIVEGMPDAPEIRHGDARAYYVACEDYINMPLMALFASAEAYYSTLFHELVHSTGHEERLARPELMEDSGMESESYSFEELVAEIGASYLNAHSGISAGTVSNSAAYIKGWLKRLRNDKSFVIKAASKAQQAVDYILQVNRISGEPEEAAAEEVRG